MAAYEHDWDTLPGEVANHVSDLEENLTRVTETIDANDTYELDDLRTDLEIIRDLAISAITELDAAAG